MSRKRRKYKPQPFESTGEPRDTCAQIFESQILSAAFLDLTKNQRLLYVCMREQLYGHRKPYKDFPMIMEWYGDELLFYFSRQDAEKYGLYNTYNNRRSFYADVKALENHGFIETVMNGRASKRKSIYRFADKWQKWKPPGD